MLCSCQNTKHTNANLAIDTTLTEKDTTNNDLNAINEEIKLSPKDAKLYYARSLIYFGKGDTIHAHQDMITARSLDSTEADYWRLDGFYHYLRGQDSLALERLMKSKKINAANSDTYHLIGNVLLLQKKYDLAITYFNKAIQLQAAKPDYYFSKAYALEQKNEFNLAIQTHEKALMYDSLFIKSLHALFEIYLYKKNEKAKALYVNKRIAQKDTTHPLYFYNYGRWVYQHSLTLTEKKAKTDSIKKAIEFFSRALYFQPGMAGAHYWRGYCFYELGFYDKALQDFELAVVTNPADARAYFMIGAIYEFYQDKEKANVFYQKTFALDPNFKGIQEALKAVKTQ